MGVAVIILIVLGAILLYLRSSIKETEEQIEREGNEIRRSVKENAEERRATALRDDISADEYHRIKEIIADKRIPMEEMRELARLVYQSRAAENTLKEMDSPDERTSRRASMALTEDANFVEDKWPDL